MNLRDKLPAGSKALILAGSVNWHGSPKHATADPTYRSDNPACVAADVMFAKSIGIDGFIPDWYGPNIELLIQTSCLLFMQELEKQQMKFALMLDSGMLKWPTPTASGQASTDFVADVALPFMQQNFFPSPAYLKDDVGKFYVYEFSLAAHGVNFGDSRFAAIHWLRQGPDYNWPEPSAPEGAVAKTRAEDKTIPLHTASVYYKFDDHDPANPKNSIWGGPARYTAPSGPWGNTWDETWKAVPPSAKVVQLATWDDEDEGTAERAWLMAQAAAEPPTPPVLTYHKHRRSTDV